ncbi:type VI secretion system Vgr family protein [Oxalobacteraceae bacterium A2-2]
MPATQTEREISVTSALAADTLLFRSMEGSEQLGRLSEFRVQLSSSNPDIQIADVLGKTMAVHLALEDGGLRHFHGVVTRFRSNGWDGDGALYEATIHPGLWLLTRCSDCRIFQDKSIPDIVADVCGAPQYGGLVELSRNALSDNHKPLPYCVQYRETDFNFVCRLLEQAGIYFYFTHEEHRHVMVLADSYGAHQPIAGGALKYFGGDGAPHHHEEAVTSWSMSGEIQSSGYALNDFDFEQAASSARGGLKVKSAIPAAFRQTAFDMYDYPGLYTAVADGSAQARRRMETLHGQCERIDAASNARALYTGGLFKLAEHPRTDQNREFLVTDATYVLRGNDYRSGGSGGGAEFLVALGAVGTEHAFRPQPVARKPLVQGPQTAMVVGKAGEEIWTDKYGRVKVQFHWDREGSEDEKSSCWVRVSQGWAGKGWGAMFIPRVGMEVVVEFLEGDPDRPLVTGCVYNSDAMPPYALPAGQTRSTIMSNSSKDGQGCNELRFEDKKDGEEVYLHAERDFLRVVKNNDQLKVGFETADKGDQDIAIKNDRRLDVGHDQQVKIGNMETIEVGKDQKIKVGKDQTLDVSANQKVKAGQTIVIEAGTSIELKVGASSVKIEAARITIKSVEIAIASDAKTQVKAGAMMELDGGSLTTLAGGLVKIN